MNINNENISPIPQQQAWRIGSGPKEYGQYLLNKRNYSHKRTNKKR